MKFILRLFLFLFVLVDIFDCSGWKETSPGHCAVTFMDSYYNIFMTSLIVSGSVIGWSAGFWLLPLLIIGVLREITTGSKMQQTEYSNESQINDVLHEESTEENKSSKWIYKWENARIVLVILGILLTIFGSQDNVPYNGLLTIIGMLIILTTIIIYFYFKLLKYLKLSKKKVVENNSIATQAGTNLYEQNEEEKRLPKKVYAWENTRIFLFFVGFLLTAGVYSNLATSIGIFIIITITIVDIFIVLSKNNTPEMSLEVNNSSEDSGREKIWKVLNRTELPESVKDFAWLVWCWVWLIIVVIDVIANYMRGNLFN